MKLLKWLKFWEKEKPAPKPEMVEWLWKVPKEYQVRFTYLYDEMIAGAEKKLPTVRFWKFVERIVPLGLGKGGSLKVDFRKHEPGLVVKMPKPAALPVTEEAPRYFLGVDPATSEGGETSLNPVIVAVPPAPDSAPQGASASQDAS